MNLTTDNRKALFLETLKSNLGNITDTAQETNISRNTHYVWMNNDPVYREKAEEISNMVFDFVESKLYRAINKEDVSAMSLYFRYSPTAKRRGWQANLDVTSGGEKLNIPEIIVSIVPPLLLDEDNQTQSEDEN